MDAVEQKAADGRNPWWVSLVLTLMDWVLMMLERRFPDGRV